jgi:hypothetical protein
MKKPNKKSKALQRKRQKAALKESRRGPQRKAALEARRQKIAKASKELYDEIKAKMVAEWEKAREQK